MFPDVYFVLVYYPEVYWPNGPAAAVIPVALLFPPAIVDAPARRTRVDAPPRRTRVDAPVRNLKVDA